MSTTSGQDRVAKLDKTLKTFTEFVSELDIAETEKKKDILVKCEVLRMLLDRKIKPQLSSEIQPTEKSEMQANLKKINKELDAYLELYPEIKKQSDLIDAIKEKERENQELRNKRMSPVPPS